MPMGPYPDLQTVIDQLGEWAKNVVGFKIKSGRGHHASKLRGTMKQLLCDRSGNHSQKLSTYDPNEAVQRKIKAKKCDCPRELWIEESAIG